MTQMTIQQAIDLGIEHHRAQRWQEAESIYQQILVAQPDHPDALHLLGLLAFQFHHNQEAAELISRAIAIAPDTAIYHYNFGQVLAALGRRADAIQSYRRAVELQPDYADACNNLGVTLVDERQLPEAIEVYRRAIALRPDCSDYHSNLSNALRENDQCDAAIESARRALALNPNSAMAHNNLGAAMLRGRQIDSAIDAYRRAIALQPEYALANYNLGVALLMKGRFSEGWPLAEWRWRAGELKMFLQNFSQPKWDGSDLNGRRILLHAEQGFGDAIQFARYVPLVADRGGHVLLAVPRELVRLMRDFPGVEQLITHGDTLPEFDVHCPLLSLPMIFNTTLETIPAAPYLNADPELTSRWRERMDARDRRLKIGLAWSGSSLHKNDRNRSAPLAALAPLARIKGTQFFSLQKGEQTSAPSEMEMIDWTRELTDFADTAALIENLDLVISVDTVVAHLAGAMGKPVWSLLAFASDWRWMLDRNGSPWYPKMRLFRQPAPGDWQSPILEMADALKELGCK